jgi:hypothetical protein
VLRLPKQAGVREYKWFRVRAGETDLGDFVGAFAEYQTGRLARWLGSTPLVVDAGAGVGAFALLALRLAAHLGLRPELIALQPDPDRHRFLAGQPFASLLSLRDEASTPTAASLEALCTRPTLLNLDLEGAELEVLKSGLPKQVEFLCLRWHHSGSPRELLPSGFLKLVSRDPGGSTSWAWERS